MTVAGGEAIFLITARERSKPIVNHTALATLFSHSRMIFCVSRTHNVLSANDHIFFKELRLLILVIAYLIMDVTNVSFLTLVSHEPLQ